MEKVDQILNQLGFNEFEKIRPLKELSHRTGLRVSYMVSIVVTILLIFVLLEWGAFLITSLVGFVYPAYCSFKAVESSEAGDDTQWLTYWVVYSFFTIFNDILFYIFGFIPFYYILKTVLYVWMFHPRTKGAQFIYGRVFRPLLLKYEGRGVSVGNKVEEGVTLLGDQIKKVGEIDEIAKKAAADTGFDRFGGRE